MVPPRPQKCELSLCAREHKGIGALLRKGTTISRTMIGALVLSGLIVPPTTEAIAQEDATPVVIVFEDVLQSLPAEGEVPALPYRGKENAKPEPATEGTEASNRQTAAVEGAQGSESGKSSSPPNPEENNVTATLSDSTSGENPAIPQDEVENAVPSIPRTPEKSETPELIAALPEVPDAPQVEASGKVEVDEGRPEVIQSGTQAPSSTAETTALESPVETAPEATGGKAAQNQEVALAEYETTAIASVYFEPGSSDLLAEAQTALQDVTALLKGNRELRIQLVAYAEKDKESPTAARRLSLSRALAVRQYLNDRGISPARVEVRALGDKAQEGLADRVDIHPRKG